MDKALSFESAYKRLEEILEILSNSQISLEESLKIYEEADKLITLCNEKLSQAEQKVQVLIKNRNQELVLQDNNEPLMEDFGSPRQHHLNRTLS